MESALKRYQGIGATCENKRLAIAQHQVQKRFVLIALIIGYIGYYLCRQNLSEAYIPMQQDLGISREQFGAFASIGTLVYAIGKLFNGSFIDSKGGRFGFLLGIGGVCFASLAFGICTAFGFMLLFWCFNRLFQSLGWGSMLIILIDHYEPGEYGAAVGALAVSYQIGGVLASLFAALLIQIGVEWRGLFIIPAIILAVIGFYMRRLPPRNLLNSPSSDKVRPIRKKLNQSNYRLLLKNKAFLAVCLLSLGLTFLREAVTFWLPSYFYDHGSSASMSAFKSAVFPLLGCLGSVGAGWYSDRYLNGRRKPIIVWSLGFLALSLFFLLNIDQLIPFDGMLKNYVSVILFGCTGFFLFAPYSMIGGGVLALDMSSKCSAATAVSLLDFSGYCGASLAGYCIAKVVSIGGWSATFVILLFVSVLCLTGSILISDVKSKK